MREARPDPPDRDAVPHRYPPTAVGLAFAPRSELYAQHGRDQLARTGQSSFSWSRAREASESFFQAVRKADDYGWRSATMTPSWVICARARVRGDGKNAAGSCKEKKEPSGTPFRATGGRTGWSSYDRRQFPRGGGPRRERSWRFTGRGTATAAAGRTASVRALKDGKPVGRTRRSGRVLHQKRRRSAQPTGGLAVGPTARHITDDAAGTTVNYKGGSPAIGAGAAMAGLLREAPWCRSWTNPGSTYRGPRGAARLRPARGDWDQGCHVGP